MATLNPIGTNILVLLDPPVTVSAGGLHLSNPRVKPDEPTWGEVVGMGEKVNEVIRGSRALTPAHKGYRYAVGSRSFLVIAEKDILALAAS